MRGAGTLLLTTMVAAGLAAPAVGRDTATVTLPLHGSISLVGHDVVCGSGRLNGETFIDCGILGRGGQPKAGSYVALMASDGKVSIGDAAGTRVLFDRIGGTMMRETGPATVHPGDTIVLPGITTISCSASNVSGKPTIFCDQVDRKGAIRPGSYAFGIGTTVVTALGWDAKGHVHLLHSWPENG